MTDFETAIAALDLNLFEKIESQSTDEDKRSLLACQLAVRELRAKYNYLEIGSYLGGSIQPYLLDPLCRRIFSIDTRSSEALPDERGGGYVYLNNSTARMLRNLSKVAATDKVTAIDGDTREIDPAKVSAKIDVCFIDGEHTDTAVLADFKFCLSVLSDSGAILFHDASIIYNGIDRCLRYLGRQGLKWRAYPLPHTVFVVEIGDFPVHQHVAILERLTNNYASYIFSLQSNDYYRQFANKTPFRLYRRFIAKWKGLNRFE
jgi:methyltransferase family protein